VSCTNCGWSEPDVFDWAGLPTCIVCMGLPGVYERGGGWYCTATCDHAAGVYHCEQRDSSEANE